MELIVKHQANYSEKISSFSRQLGVKNIQLSSPEFLGEAYFEYEKIIEIKKHIEEGGQMLGFIENVPWKMSYKITYGLPGRDEQIDNFIKTLRNLGKAGIGALGFNFMPTKVWRTDYDAPARGGATASAFDAAKVLVNRNINSVHQMKGIQVDIKPDRGALKESFLYFINAVMPEAEKSNVKLALHPDDPPIPEIDGVARIFNSMEDFKWAIGTAASSFFGLNLCLGCFSSMPDGGKKALES
jgi:mannonate dehydratase